MATPEISAETCLLASQPASTCSACAAACPRQALFAVEEGLGLDEAACTGCGACAAVCPAGAIALGGAEAPVPLDRPRARGWLACDRHPRGADGQGLCLQSLGLAALARLWLAGLRDLTCLTADCAACPNGVGLDAEGEVRDLNRLLASRGLAEFTLSRGNRVPAAAVRIGPSDAAQSRGRRRLLGLARETAAEARPLKQLQHQGGGEALHAFVPVMDAGRCTGCDACVRVCPEGVLSLIKDGNGNSAYETEPSSCTGCGLCADMCDSGAIHLERLAPAPAPLALADFRCRGCGVEVHVPTAAAGDDGLCPVCRRTGHHKKLFQVLQ